MQYLVYSDLDGTLLDEDYSFDNAITAINTLKQAGIPLILTSSKTRLEIESYRSRMGNNDPFISENGSAIYIPKKTFKNGFEYDEESADYYVIGFGYKSGQIREIVSSIREEHGLNFTLFNDMTIQELADDSGLPIEEARMAMEREYSVVATSLDAESIVILQNKGLGVKKGGRYYCICASDKGTAVETITEIYGSYYDKLTTIGIGDSKNDVDMLKKVDIPILVGKPDGSYDETGLENVLKADGIGPSGWNKQIINIVREYKD